jgi:hypothetical protein
LIVRLAVSKEAKDLKVIAFVYDLRIPVVEQLLPRCQEEEV